jgi:hypothetical protein
LRAEPQTIGSRAFYGVNSACILYVPAGSVAAYQSADVWNDIKQILPIPQNGK